MSANPTLQEQVESLEQRLNQANREIHEINLRQLHATGSLVRVMAILEELRESGVVTAEMMAKVETRIENDLKGMME